LRRQVREPPSGRGAAGRATRVPPAAAVIGVRRGKTKKEKTGKCPRRFPLGEGPTRRRCRRAGMAYRRPPGCRMGAPRHWERLEWEQQELQLRQHPVQVITPPAKPIVRKGAEP